MMSHLKTEEVNYTRVTPTLVTIALFIDFNLANSETMHSKSYSYFAYINSAGPFGLCFNPVLLATLLIVHSLLS